MTHQKCDSCKVKFTRKYAFMKHRLNCGRFKLRYQCIDCEEKFSYHHGLIRHAQNQHLRKSVDHFVLLDVDCANENRVVYQKLYSSTEFILEEVFETVIDRRLEQLVPHVLPLFQYLGSIADDPHSMLSFYQSYRGLVLADSASHGFTGQAHVNWLSQHHVLEPVQRRKYAAVILISRIYSNLMHFSVL